MVDAITATFYFTVPGTVPGDALALRMQAIRVTRTAAAAAAPRALFECSIDFT